MGNDSRPLTHYDLCKITAEKFIKTNDVALFEYQSYATGEFPDVLCFKGAATSLFEIKVTKQDFKADSKKDCRIKYRMKYFNQYDITRGKIDNLFWNHPHLHEFRQERPHLGRRRYYVCPKGLIHPDEIHNGWGLYWYSGKFFKKKESSIFRNNIYDEISILTHAFRKHDNGYGDNIMVRKYSR